jgi:hypothetical protein
MFLGSLFTSCSYRLLFVGGAGGVISNPNIVDGLLHLGRRMNMSLRIMGGIMRDARGQKEMS